MGGGVSGEEASVHDPGAEPLEKGLRWTPAPRDGSRRSFGVIQELAAVDLFR